MVYILRNERDPIGDKEIKKDATQNKIQIFICNHLKDDDDDDIGWKINIVPLLSEIILIF